MGEPNINFYNCSSGYEDPECRSHLEAEAAVPSLPTIDIVNPTPEQLQPLFSRDSWMYYWNRSFGKGALGVSNVVFSLLDQRDGISGDNFLDISRISAKDIESTLERIRSTNDEEGNVIEQMKDRLVSYRSRTLKVYYMTDNENQLVGVDGDGNIVGIDGLENEWAAIKEQYPNKKIARLVIDGQTFAGVKPDSLNPERQGVLSPISYLANPAVTGGLGVFNSNSSIEILPYSAKVAWFGPDFVDSTILVFAAVTVALAAIWGKRGNGGPMPAVATGEMGPLTGRGINISLPEAVIRDIGSAMERNGRDMSTIYFSKRENDLSVSRPSKLIHHKVVNSEGQKISVYEKNPDQTVTDLPPILLIHSATFSSLPEYYLQVKGYSLMDNLVGKGHRVFAVDIRGYGNSYKPARDVWVTTELAIMDIQVAVKFIQQRTGFPTVNILGWSWGTQVGGLFTQQYPALVNKLILYAPFWRGINAEIPEPMKTRRLNNHENIVGDFLDPSRVEPRVVAEFERLCKKYDFTSPIGSWKDLKGLGNKPILDPQRIRVPTLIIYGERDHLVLGDDILEFHRLLPIENKPIVVVPNTDHMLHLEINSGIFVKEVDSFLK